MAITDEELKKLPDNPDKAVAAVGKDTLLYIAKEKAGTQGTDDDYTYVRVGGQRNSPVNSQANSIDASHKTSGGWGSNLPGLKTWNIAYSGLQVMDDDGLAILEYAYRESHQVHVKIVYSDKSYQTGWAYVTQFNKDNSYTAVSTVSVTLSGQGAISAVTPATTTTSSSTSSGTSGSGTGV